MTSRDLRPDPTGSGERSVQPPRLPRLRDGAPRPWSSPPTWASAAGGRRRAVAAPDLRGLRPRGPADRRGPAHGPADHDHGQRGRHRLLRPPAHGGRPGHHHLDRDDHRRGARPARGEGATSPSPPPAPSCCSTSSPVAPTPPSRRTPRSGSPPRSPRAPCWRPPRSSSARPSRCSTSKDGVITAPDGASVTYGELADEGRQPDHEAGRGRAQGRGRLRGHRQAASTGSTPATSSPARRSSRWTSTSPTPCRRWSAGRRRSTASPQSLRNQAAVLAMPGVTDVAPIATGVAVRARDLRPVHRRHPRARRRLEPRHRSRASPTRRSCAELRKAELPLAVPKVPVLAKTVEADFTFMFRSSAALEPYAAIADVRADRAEVWAGLKVADRRAEGHRQGDRPAAGRRSRST